MCCVESRDISKLHSRWRGTEMECDSHSYCMLPAGLIAQRQPLKKDQLSRCLPSPQGCAAPSWQGCDASRVSLCGGLHLGLQVQIKIRFHIYVMTVSQQWFFIENTSCMRVISVLQVKNIKAFSPDGRITGQQGGDLQWDSKWLTCEYCTFELKSFQLNQWNPPPFLVPLPPLSTDLHNLVNKSDLIWCFQPLSSMELMGDWAIIILPRLSEVSLSGASGHLFSRLVVKKHKEIEIGESRIIPQLFITLYFDILNLKQLHAYNFHQNIFSQTILKDGVINNPNEIFKKDTFFSWYITYINKPQTKYSCIA